MARKRKELNDLHSQQNLPKTHKQEEQEEQEAKITAIITASPTKQQQQHKQQHLDQKLIDKASSNNNNNSNSKNIMLHLKTEQPPCLHSSDSEVMELHKKIELQKTKKNLFLIKSYSFIDKTNHKPLKVLKVNTKNCEEIVDKITNKSNGEKFLEKLHKDDKLKLKKMKKSKSTYDSTEDLNSDIKDILRRQEKLELPSSKRPLSMPVQQLNKSKDDFDLNCSPITPKRESFLRHSLQSIRRSFSSKKHQQKHNGNNSNNSNNSNNNNSNNNSSNNCDKNINLLSSSSASSAASTSSYSSSSSSSSNNNNKKSKKSSKDQDCNKNLAQNINNNNTTQQARLIKLTVNNNNGSTAITPTKAIGSVTTPPLQHATMQQSTADCFSQQMDNLSILNEEDEKDLQQSCGSSSTSLSLNKKAALEQQENCFENQRSTSSVSTLAYLPTESNTPMAPLQQNTETQSVQCLNTSSPKLNQQQENQQQQQQQQQSAKRQTLLQHQLSTPEPLLRSTTPIGCTASATSTSSSSDYSSARSLKDNQSTSASLNPLQTVDSSSSVRSISPSRRSAGSNGSSTAKHESTAAATAAQQSAGAAATTSNASPSTSNAVTTTTTPPSSEKEKKRKEISSSRVKKFHRHFAQVSKDEKLINYFSCALVSDILLQGHLYITDQHFAFYSNVFGYVTKVVIPTSSVTKISKEKTAKIIPNAVGVATADERHVFGSFISREAAFRLMCSVCPPLIPVEILPKDPANIEICEEYSIEDDSSCSISGNESPAQAGGNSSQDSQGLLRRSNLSIPESSTGAAEHIKLRHSDIPFNANSNNQQASLGLRASAPPTAPLSHSSNGTMSAGGDAKLSSMQQQQQQQPAANAAHTAALIAGLVDTTNIPFIVAGSISTSTTSANSTPTASTTSSPTTVMTPMGLRHSKVQHLMDKVQIWSKNLALKIKYPTEIRVVYLGVLLTIILAVFSIFLLYRILDIEAKATIYRSPIDFNWQSPNDDGILAEALRFQRELQQKTTEEAQNILKTNLEQIAKVRRSLETLSTLIHDRSGSSFATTVHTDDSD